MLALLLQATPQDIAFFPQTLDVWLRVLFQSAVIAGTVGAFMYKQLMKPINGLGGRLDTADKHITTNTTDIAAIKTQNDIRAMKDAQDSERMGRMEGTLQALNTSVLSIKDKANAEDRVVGERLMAIETKMSVFAELKDALVAITENYRPK